jgi:hypothetical protein
VANAPGNPTGPTTDRTLDTATRQRLLVLLQEELAQVSGDALGNGMSPDELAAQFDERITRLRAQIANSPPAAG